MGLTLFPGGRERFPQGTPHGPGASDLQCGFQGLGGQVGVGNALAALHLAAGVDAAEDGQAAAVPAGS